MQNSRFIIDIERPINEVIDELKYKSVEIPSWSKLLKDYEPTMHKIVSDHSGRKDRVRDDGVAEKASRITLGLEKLLCKRITEFTFSIPVRRIYSNVDGNERLVQVQNAIEAIYKNVHIDTENIKRGNAYYAACELFTIWYVVEKPNNLYGFPCKYKLKCKTYSPMDGVSLYPLFDELGDMLAMSFEYSRKENGNEVLYFETYTSNNHYKWKQTKDGYELLVDEEIILGKIPGVYIYRNEPVFNGLTNLREEIEYTLSRNSDVIAYNAAPVLMVSGKLVGDEDKGEARRLFRVENGGNVSYVSWSQAIEALKYHVDTAMKMFFMQAQIPDLSFDNLKSLGNIGYDARKMILTDAHLRIGDESGAWIEFFDRENNVVKEFLKLIKSEWKNDIEMLAIENVITPYIQNDEDALIARLQKGNGGKALFSQLDSIRMAGYTNNAKETLEQIQKEDSEAQKSRMNNLFESAE